MPRKLRKTPAPKAHSVNVLDYPSAMSGFEKESLAAEAKIKAELETQKSPNPRKKRAAYPNATTLLVIQIT